MVCVSGSAEVMFGLEDLKGLFQPQRSHDLNNCSLPDINLHCKARALPCGGSVLINVAVFWFCGHGFGDYNRENIQNFVPKLISGPSLMKKHPIATTIINTAHKGFLIPNTDLLHWKSQSFFHDFEKDLSRAQVSRGENHSPHFYKPRLANSLSFPQL